MSLKKTFHFAVLALLTLCCGSSFALDLLEEGQKLYAAGQYAQAANLFNSYSISNPNNVTAQYYLANCYVGLKRTDDAVEHYQKVVQLAPKSKVGDFSRSEIAKIQASSTPPAAAVSSDQHVPSQANDAQADYQKAARARKIEAKEQAIEAEYEVRIKQVEDDAKGQIERLQKEKTEKISELGTPLHGRNGVVWSPNPEPLNSEYKRRVDDVNKEAARKVAELKAECDAKVAVWAGN